MSHLHENSTIRIFARNGKTTAVGVLISNGRILTCGHVLKHTLISGTQDESEEYVTFDFPFIAPGNHLKAKVLFCEDESKSDIAILEIESNLPENASPAPLVIQHDLWGHSFRSIGFPFDRPDGIWATGRIMAKNAAGWLQVEDVKEAGYSIKPGFSGGAVWDDTQDAVIGIVVAADETPGIRAAWMIPIELIAAVWPELRGEVVIISEENKKGKMDQSLSAKVQYIARDAGRIVNSPGSYVESNIETANIVNIHQTHLQQQWLRPEPYLHDIEHLDEAVGRSAELDSLSNLLKPSQGQTVSVTGLPGIGKSTLAALFARQYNSLFSGGVLWAELGPDLSQIDQLQPIWESWASWAYGGDVQVFQDTRGHFRRLLADPENIHRLLSGHGNLLAVIDNVYHSEPVQELIKSLPSGSCVLITSRLDLFPEKTGIYSVLDLKEMGVDDCVKFLDTQLGHQSSRELLIDLANALSGHPHELQMAASYLKQIREDQRTDEILKYVQQARSGNKSAQVALRFGLQDLIQHWPNAESWVGQLGVFCKASGDFSTDAASFVWKTSVAEAESFLWALRQRSLVQSARQSSDRWILPPLLKGEFVRRFHEQINSPEIQERYYAYYIELARSAIATSTDSGSKSIQLELQHILAALDYQVEKLGAGSGIEMADIARQIADGFCEFAIYLQDHQLEEHLTPWIERAATTCSQHGFQFQAVQLWLIFAISLRTRALAYAEPSSFFARSRKALDEAFLLAEDPIARAWVDIWKGRIALDQNLQDDALVFYRNALKEGELAQDIEIQISAGYSIATIEALRKNRTAAFEHYEKAIRLAAQQERSDYLINLHFDLGDMQVQAEEYPAALHSFQSALNLVEPRDTPLGRARILTRIGQVYEAQHRSTEAILILRQARETLNGTDFANSYDEAIILESLAASYYTLDNKEECWSALEQALEITRNLESNALLARLERNGAQVKLAQGQVEDAVQLLMESLELSRQMKDMSGESLTHMRLASAYLAQGKPSDAIQEGQLAWQGLLDNNQRDELTILLLEMISMYRLSSQLEEGFAFFEKVEAGLANKNFYITALTTRIGCIVLLLDKGETSAALDILAALPDKLDLTKCVDKDEQALGNFLLGYSSLMQDQHQSASSFFEESLKLFEGANLPSTHVQVLQSIIDLHYQMGQYEDARNYIERALKIASMLQNRSHLHALYLRESLVQEALGQMDKALDANQHAIDQLDAGLPTLMLGQMYSRQGDLLIQANVANDADRSFDRCQTLGEELELKELVVKGIFGHGMVDFICRKNYEVGLSTMEKAIELLEKEETKRNISSELPAWQLRLLYDNFRSQISPEAIRDGWLQFVRITGWEDLRRVLVSYQGPLRSQRAIQALDGYSIGLAGNPEGELVIRVLRLYGRLMEMCQTKGVEDAIREIRQHRNVHLFYYWWGGRMRAEREYGAALKYMNMAIELKPDEVQYLVERGWIYRGLGTYQQALADFDKAVKLAHNYPAALLGRGAIWYEMRRYGDAINEFNGILKMNGRIAFAYHWRGSAKLSNELPREALEDFEKAIQLDGRNASHQYWRAIAYLHLYEYESALTDFQSVIRQDENRPEALVYDLLWAGVAYRMLGQMRQSEDAWRRSEEAIPKIQRRIEQLLAHGLKSLLERKINESRQSYEAAVRMGMPRHARHTHWQHFKLLQQLDPLRKDLQSICSWMQNQL